MRGSLGAGSAGNFIFPERAGGVRGANPGRLWKLIGKGREPEGGRRGRLETGKGASGKSEPRPWAKRLFWVGRSNGPGRESGTPLGARVRFSARRSLRNPKGLSSAPSWRQSRAPPLPFLLGRRQARVSLKFPRWKERKRQISPRRDRGWKSKNPFAPFGSLDVPELAKSRNRREGFYNHGNDVF